MNKSDDWFPIDTAPKEGIIDLWVSNPDHAPGYREVNCSWDTEDNMWMSGRGQPVEYWNAKTEEPAIKATHWRHRPSPPKEIINSMCYKNQKK